MWKVRGMMLWRKMNGYYVLCVEVKPVLRYGMTRS
jgi:hypothetical protein